MAARLPTFLPSAHQPPLPLDRLVVRGPSPPDAVRFDVLFVGGGPAGLAGAIELARLCRECDEPLEIGVLEKAADLGGHSLSGAVVNPRAFRALFPEMQDRDFPFRGPVGREAVYLLGTRGALRVPRPPTMENAGFYTASLCEIVRWLGERAEELGVTVLTGFPAAQLRLDGARVAGVRTAPSGLLRDGTPGPNHQPATEIAARVTALAEGTRGALTQAWQAVARVGSGAPQIYALGVKELWDAPGGARRVIHTLGWPLPSDAFGGGFLYPMGGRQVAVGLVLGLDYRPHRLDAHELLQRLKTHPLVRGVLEGGEMLEWGAKTIPEGGWHALPERLSGDGVVLLGDAAGLVDVPSLKGIHYAMHSGILAARAIHAALREGGATAEALRRYDVELHRSHVARDLRERRNMRLAFRHGLYAGGVRAAVMTATRGRWPGDPRRFAADADQARVVDGVTPPAIDGRLTFGKLDAVYRSGNRTRDDGPSHLVVPPQVAPAVAEFYAHVCPAGVYEPTRTGLTVNAPNCIDCKATDVLGPRWTPREGGAGPRYRNM